MSLIKKIAETGAFLMFPAHYCFYKGFYNVFQRKKIRKGLIFMGLSIPLIYGQFQLESKIGEMTSPKKIHSQQFENEKRELYEYDYSEKKKLSTTGISTLFPFYGLHKYNTLEKRTTHSFYISPQENNNLIEFEKYWCDYDVDDNKKIDLIGGPYRIEKEIHIINRKHDGRNKIIETIKQDTLEFDRISEICQNSFATFYD